MKTRMNGHAPSVPLPLFALAAGGILVVVGHALSTPIEGTGESYVTRFAANRGEHFMGLLLTTIGALLLIPGVMGVLRVLDGRSTLAQVGCTLGCIGAAALGVGDGVITFTMGTLTAKDLGLAASVYDAMNQSNLAGLPFMFAPLFVLGHVLLGILWCGWEARCGGRGPYSSPAPFSSSRRGVAASSQRQRSRLSRQGSSALHGFSGAGRAFLPPQDGQSRQQARQRPDPSPRLGTGSRSHWHEPVIVLGCTSLAVCMHHDYSLRLWRGST